MVVYPTLTATLPQNPNKFWAVPIIGILVKVIILIPQFIELMFLGIAWGFISIINSFIVLFTGKYWDTAYIFVIGIMRLTTKVTFYMFGFTDKYPGFDFAINDTFSIEMAKPENPNRLFAIPFFGGLARILLLIPFIIWQVILNYASVVGIFVSFAPVLFAGKYPESTFELGRDYTRITLATTAYMGGLSDSYPSFAISWNHKVVKIILIILGILLYLLNAVANSSSYKKNYSTNDYNMTPQTDYMQPSEDSSSTY